jgi:hypothetical protein
MRLRDGHGIFTWDGGERRSTRYGAFVLSCEPVESNDRTAAYLDLKVLRALEGKRVHVRCVVVAARKSGHIGDLAHGIFPTTPEVGEEVDLGVGTLRLEPAPFDGLTQVTLVPGDGRDRVWIDPHKLYRLHDQTVDLFVEETTEDFTPEPYLVASDRPESVDVGDGTFQITGVKHGTNVENLRIEPDIERLGDGLLLLKMPDGLEAGKRRKVSPR